MNFSLCLLVGALIASGIYTDAAKILAIAPMPQYSHFISQFRLYSELAESGHEITVVSAFPNNPPIANYTDVPLVAVKDFMEKMKQQFERYSKMGIAATVHAIYTQTVEMSRVVAYEESLQKLLQSNAKFDLIIIELCLDDFLIGLGHYYNAPIIALTTLPANKWVNDYVGNPNPVSYVPHLFLSTTNIMTFGQRLVNTVVTYLEEILMETLYHPQQEILYNEVFPDPKPTYSEARKSAVDLVFINTHFSLTSSRPHVSNVIEIGGIHVNQKTNPLPNDIKSFIDSAEHGVVYFALGSNIRASMLGPDKRKAFINSLLKLKEHIIWKWEGDLPEIEGKTNFYVSKWLPQDDILRHPKIKLFITHAGAQSIIETIYHGVPVVGIPVLGDQEMNMAKAEQLGCGKGISIKILTEENLTEAIYEVLNKDIYKTTVKTISKRFRDTPMPPLELAKYWVEYVIRHKGAKHMRSAAMELNFFQLYSFDTLGLIFAVLFLVFGAFVLLIKKLIRTIFGSPQKKQKLS